MSAERCTLNDTTFGCACQKASWCTKYSLSFRAKHLSCFIIRRCTIDFWWGSRLKSSTLKSARLKESSLTGLIDAVNQTLGMRLRLGSNLFDESVVIENKTGEREQAFTDQVSSLLYEIKAVHEHGCINKEIHGNYGEQEEWLAKVLTLQVS